jgi:hypothetical protein
MYFLLRYSTAHLDGPTPFFRTLDQAKDAVQSEYPEETIAWHEYRDGDPIWTCDLQDEAFQICWIADRLEPNKK